MSQLEASLPRPPFEALSHIVRNSQKIVLKELTTATSAAKQLSSTLTPPASASKANRQQPTQVMTQADKQLAALIATVGGLKRRLEEMERMAQRQARGLAVRLEYLAQMEREEQTGGVIARRAGVTVGGAGGGEEKRREGEKQKARDMDVEQAEAGTKSTDTPSSTSNGHSNGHQQPNGSHSAASHSSFSLDSIAATTPPPTASHRLHRLFLDYCLRSSLYRTAAALSSSASPQLAALSDTSLFSSMQGVVAGLRVRDVSRLLAWCGEWRSRLVRMGSSLEWDARCVDMMEMVKRGERDTAMEYGRKWLGVGVTAGREGGAKEEEKEEKEEKEAASENDSKSQWDDSVVQERLRKLQEAVTAALYYPLFHPASSHSPEAVLFTSSSTAYHKYSRYWSDERWADLEYQFRLTHLAVHGLPQHSQLALVLFTGMATLRTPYCRCPPNDKLTPATTLTTTHSSSSSSASSSLPSSSIQPIFPSSPASSCPVCSSRVLFELSGGLPVTQRSQSCLVCGLTGSVMDEHNPPLVLPNGCVYSKNALMRMAQADGGYVTCVRTQERYALEECKQAFVL